VKGTIRAQISVISPEYLATKYLKVEEQPGQKKVS